MWNDFVSGLERHFKLEFPAQAPSHILTVRDLIDHLADRLDAASGPGICLTQRAFYCVRHAFITGLGVERFAIRPQTQLATLVPRSTRRQSWSELRVASQIKRWPSLHRPDWLNLTILGLGFGAGLTAFFKTLTHQELGMALLVGMATWLLTGITFLAITVAWKTEFAPQHRTVGDLARVVLAESPIGEHDFRWTRPQIASVVRALIIEKLDILPGEFDESTGFADMDID